MAILSIPQAAYQDPIKTALGLKQYNYPPLIHASAITTSTTVIYAVAIPTIAGETYTGAKLCVVQIGVSTVPTGFYVGLAEHAAVASTGLMLAQSGNLNTSSSLTTSSFGSYPFGAPYTETVSGLRMGIILKNVNFAGTDVTFERQSAPGATGPIPIAATATGGGTTLPANGAALGAYTLSGALQIWFGLY